MIIIDTVLVCFVAIVIAIAAGFLSLFLFGIGSAIIDIPKELKKIRIILERSEGGAGEKKKEKS